MKLPETGQNSSKLITEIERLSKTARELDATKGAQRLHFIGKYYRRLSIEEAYHLLDPEALQREVEETQGDNSILKLLYFLRIGFSLAPLILTWIALFYATSEYQQYLQRYPNAVYTPFLELWQSGFGGNTPFTFAATALLDASLLIIFLIVSLVILSLENRASKKSRNFANELETVTEELMNAVAKEGLAPITSDKDFDKIAAAISFGLNKNIEASEQIVNSAQIAVGISTQIMDQASQRINGMMDSIIKMMEDVIKESNRQLENLFNNEIKTMIDRFRDDLSTLHDDLGQLGIDMENLRTYVQKHDERLKEFTDVSSLLAGASSNLVTNTNKMAASTNDALSINQYIRNQISNLNTTQQQLLIDINTSQKELITQIEAIGGNMNTVVQSVTDNLNTTQQQLLMDINTSQKELITQIEAIGGNMNTVVQSVTDNLYQSTKSEIQAMPYRVTEVADQVSKIAEGLTNVSGALLQADSPLIQAAQQLQNAAQALASSQELAKVEDALRQLDLQLSIMIKEIQIASQASTSNRVRVRGNSSLRQPLDNVPPQPRSFWDWLLRR